MRGRCRCGRDWHPRWLGRNSYTRICVGCGERTKTCACEHIADRPVIDHGLLSPSGRMSQRARWAALAREYKKMFPPALLALMAEVPQEGTRDYLLRRAAELRSLAARGMNSRTYSRLAATLEKEAAKLD